MRLGKYVRLLSMVAPLALMTTACSDDPTDEGAGDAFAIVTNKSVTELAANESFTVTAYVVDRGGTPLPTEVAVTSAKPAAVTVDSTRFVPELQETRIYARTLSVDASAPLVLSAGAVTDTVEVQVTSGPFPGTVATAAFAGGTVLQFTSTTPLFDANTSATVSASEDGFVVDVSPTQLRFLLPFGEPAGAIPYAITGAGPSDFSLSGTFNLAQAIACDDPYEPNNSVAEANTTALTIGTPLYGSGSLGGDPNDFYRFTVTEAGTYVVAIDWSDDADLDIYLRNSAGANMAGFAGATVAKPERITMNLAAGDYYVQTDFYDSAGGPCTTFKITVTPGS